MNNDSFFSRVKTLFFNGLFTILPLVVTIYVINFAVNLLRNWLAPLRKVEPVWLQKIPGSEIVVIFLLIIVAGVILRFFIVRPLVHYFESLIARIPIIKSIYSAAKSLASFFDIPEKSDIKRKVVLVEFPLPNYYNIAFLLGSAADNFQQCLPESQKQGEEHVRVFMPNTPNPSTGYFFVIPKSKIIETEISFEEAIKTIASCGLITPKSFHGEDPFKH
jgi:uncharacterized membrane protein